MFNIIAELLGTRHKVTTAYHPQANGQAENMVKTISDLLSRMVLEKGRDWDEYIPYALWAYRTATHEVTKETPFFMVYGRDPRDTTNDQFLYWQENHPNASEYTETIIKRLIDARQRVIDATVTTKIKEKERYDSKRKESEFKINDIVWLRKDEREKGTTPKLSVRWTGPYRIFDISKNRLNVSIRHIHNNRDTRVVHVERLKKGFLRAGESIAETKPPEGEDPLLQFDSTIEKKDEHAEAKDRLNRTKKRKSECQNRRNLKKARKEEKGKEKIDENSSGKTKSKFIVNLRGRKRGGGEKNEKGNEEGSDRFEITEILDERITKAGMKEFLVKFNGYTKRYDEWVKEKDLDADRLIEQWRAKKRRIEASKPRIRSNDAKKPREIKRNSRARS